MFNLMSPINAEAIPWTCLVTVVVTVLTGLLSRNSKTTVRTLLTTLLFSFCCIHFTLYFICPSLTGTFGGYEPLLQLSALIAIAVGCFNMIVALWQNDCAKRRQQYRYRSASEETSQGLKGRVGEYIKSYRPNGYSAALAVTFTAAGLLLTTFFWWSVKFCLVSFGADNALVWSNLANVRIADKTEKLPPTDPNHIVLVTRQIAFFRGQQSMASTGENLGSIYKTDLDDYTLQSVNGHLWWIAQLEYANFWNQVGIFSSQVDASPGFIAVDAEDPDGEVKLVKSKPMRYLLGAYFGQNLLRHVYRSGYMYGDLDEPTIEVDDDWNPYVTITYNVPKFGIAYIGGEVIKKVLLIDAGTGTIAEYDLGATPAWVDRVMSDDLVLDYVTNWGAWHDKRSRDQWPNFGGQFAMKPREIELAYNTAARPVWMLPMTSLHGSDASATGVILYDSNKNEAVFYNGFSGVGVGDNVTKTFQSSPSNIRNYPVGDVQLYSINGTPTWVAVYCQNQGMHGASFAAVGLVDARSLNGANVVMAPDKQTALRSYANWLATGGANDGEVSRTGQPTKATAGTITRIGWTIVNGQAIYSFTVDTDSHLFTASLKTFPALPVVMVGDQVSLTYLDTGEDSAAVITLENTSLRIGQAGAKE